MSLPEVLEQALDARTAYDACNRTLHPRISERLFLAYGDARVHFLSEYPELDEWLFGYPYRNHAERLAELRRLVTP